MVTGLRREALTNTVIRTGDKISGESHNLIMAAAGTEGFKEEPGQNQVSQRKKGILNLKELNHIDYLRSV